MQLRLTGLLWSIIGDVSIISKSYPNSLWQYFSGASLVLSYGRKTLLARSVLELELPWCIKDAGALWRIYGTPHTGALRTVVWEFPEGEKWELWPMCSWFKCRGMYCWPRHVPGSKGRRCFYWLVSIQDLVQTYGTSPSRMHFPKHIRILRSRSKKWWKREHRVQIRTAARGLSTGFVGESQGQGQEWANL